MKEHKWFPKKNRNSYLDALLECVNEGFVPRPFFEIVQERIDDPSIKNPYWGSCASCSTVSEIKKDGEILGVVSHLPNALTDPNYVRKMMNNYGGSIPLPDSDIIEMLNNDGKLDEHGNKLVSIRPKIDWTKANHEMVNWKDDYYTYNYLLIGGQEMYKDRFIEINHPLNAAFGTYQREKAYLKSIEKVPFQGLNGLYYYIDNPPELRDINLARIIAFSDHHRGHICTPHILAETRIPGKR